MQLRGPPSEPSSSTFEVLLGEKPSGKGTRRYLNLGQSFQFYALLLLILLGHLLYASICEPGRFYKRQKLRVWYWLQNNAKAGLMVHSKYPYVV